MRSTINEEISKLEEKLKDKTMPNELKQNIEAKLRILKGNEIIKK